MTPLWSGVMDEMGRSCGSETGRWSNWWTPVQRCGRTQHDVSPDRVAQKVLVIMFVYIWEANQFIFGMWHLRKGLPRRGGTSLLWHDQRPNQLTVCRLILCRVVSPAPCWALRVLCLPFRLADFSLTCHDTPSAEWQVESDSEPFSLGGELLVSNPPHSPTNHNNGVISHKLGGERSWKSHLAQMSGEISAGSTWMHS